MSRARARTEGLLIMTTSTDALPGEPSENASNQYIASFPKHMHVARNKEHFESKVFCAAVSAPFAFVLPWRRQRSRERSGRRRQQWRRQRQPPSPPTRRRTREVWGKVAATPRARKYCRVSILDPHQAGSPRGLLVVTACHVGSLKGQRHPEEFSSELVGHPSSELWRRSQPVVVLAIHL